MTGDRISGINKRRDQVYEMLTSVGSNGEKMTVTAVASELGLAAQTVYKYAKELGIPTPGNRSKLDELDDETIDLILKDYEGGMPVVQICAKYNFGNMTFYKMLATLGVTPTHLRVELLEAKNLPMEAAVDMYKDGWVIWFIKEMTMVDPVSLMKELARHPEIPRRGAGTRWKVPARTEDGRLVLKGTKDHTDWLAKIAEARKVTRERVRNILAENERFVRPDVGASEAPPEPPKEHVFPPNPTRRV